MGSVIFSLELTAEGKIFYESDNTIIYYPLYVKFCLLPATNEVCEG